MSITPIHDGRYDDHGNWVRSKFCFADCGAACTCSPPGGRWYDRSRDKRRIHELKCYSEPFQAVLQGTKRFEYRLNDRDFRVNDVLLLREWKRHERVYTGDECMVRVTYISELPIQEDGHWYVVMSIEPAR